MLEFVAELGLKMAGWPRSAQSTFFVGYAVVVFGVSGLLDHWLRKRTAGLPRSVGKVWIPLYIASLVVATLAMIAVTTAAKTVSPYSARLAAAPASGRDYINTIQYASVVSLAFVAYFGYALLASARPSSAADDRGGDQY